MAAHKKSSPAKAAAARANGSKSRGPKTSAGKKKSSQNSIKHGARASRRTPLLLPGEDSTKLQLYTDAFYQYFRPQNLAEAALVDVMIAQIWKTARILGYESEILTCEAEDLHEKLVGQYDSISATRLFALAFQDSSEKGRNPLILRYQIALRNMFRSALADLLRMRAMHASTAESFLQPPKVIRSVDTFCIDPEALPVGGLQDVTTGLSETPASPITTPEGEPPAPPEPPPFYYSPEPEPQPQTEPAMAFTPPTPPEPRYQPAAPAPQGIELYPMLPLRDKTTEAIVLNTAGKPIWLPNPAYIHQPGVTPPLFPFAGETFDFGLFPDKHLIPNMLRDGYFHNDARMNEDALPNEPKPPATETHSTASSPQYAQKPRK